MTIPTAITQTKIFENAAVKPESDSSAALAQSSDWPAQTWWRDYGDPQLDALIDEGLSSSPDLRSADARLRLALARMQSAGANLGPSLSANAAYATTQQSLNEGFPDAFKSFLPQGWNDHGRITLDFAYQLDFFGRNRAAFAAATSEAQAAKAESEAARLQLSAAIAAAYADLQRLYANRRTVEDSVKIRSDTESLLAQRIEAGLENEGRLNQAKAETASAKEDLNIIDRQVELTRNAIAALLGKGPDRGQEITPPAAINLRAGKLPAHLALNLLGRRPDIIAARLRAQAAAARIKMAKADFYPNIDIMGSIGQQALGLDLLGKADSRFGSFGPAINLPIFAAGRLQAQYRASAAEYDSARANYESVVANALRETADAIANQRALQAELVNAREALAASEKAYQIQKLRYEGGLAPYLEVLTAESAVLGRRRNVVNLEAQAFSIDVALIRALGGGFNDSRPILSSGQRTRPDA